MSGVSLSRERKQCGGAEGSGGTTVVVVSGAGLERPNNTLYSPEELERRRQRRQAKKAKLRWERVHWTQKPLGRMNKRDWRIMREDNNIVVKRSLGSGRNHQRSTENSTVPNPIRSWEESALPQALKSAVVRGGYVSPTPVQMQLIPLALARRDVVGVAPTGAGKTLAFGLPLLAVVSMMPSRSRELAIQEGAYALVIAPTRELAQQIAGVLHTVAMALEVGFAPRVVCITGGHAYAQQSRVLLEGGVDVLVATPGRLFDMLSARHLTLQRCVEVVIDEADRMVDMGLGEQLEEILALVPPLTAWPFDLEQLWRAAQACGDGYATQQLTESMTRLCVSGEGTFSVARHTMMLSATMPKEMARMAEAHCAQATLLIVGEVIGSKPSVTNTVEVVRECEKPGALARLLRQQVSGSAAIVFANKRARVGVIANQLRKEGFYATALHGGMKQRKREQVLDQFMSYAAGGQEGRTTTVLVGTGVVGRGIDFANVPLVVNYDMPATIECM